jgi:hypothetical protein
MATTIRARIYARGEVSFAKFLFLPGWFAKLLEANFFCFAKIIWMLSWFVKLLELLRNRYVQHGQTHAEPSISWIYTLALVHCLFFFYYSSPIIIYFHNI